MENHVEPSAPPPANRKWCTFACLTILGLALLASFQSAAERSFTTQDDIVPVDFPVFYIGGKVALQRCATPLYYPPADRGRGYTLLYDNAADSTPWAQMGRANGFPQIMQFTNPPFSALLMAPLAILPWQWAYLIWQIIIIILAAATIFFALMLLDSGPTIQTFAMVFAATCFFFPFKSNLVFGQVNTSILFLWALGVCLLKRRQPVASALCFALGTALKVSPVVAVPLLLLRRQWRWLTAYVAGVIAFTGISIWRLGWQTHVTWLTAIYPCISTGLGNNINRSFAGLVDVLVGPKYFASQLTATEWPVPHGLGLIEKACSLAIGLGFIYWCWRRRKDAKGLVEELVLLPLVYLLAAPFSWPHHFILALLPLTYLWVKAREATTAELVALYLSTLVIGTELPMYLAAYSPWANPKLIIVATALWPAATCAMIWVGLRTYVRSRELEARQAIAGQAAAAA
jgi:alpha-1,2-mannosyltransferase